MVSARPVRSAAETEMWVTGPRQVVASLLHAAALPASAWGPSRIVNLPGKTFTVAEMIDALTRVAGSTPATRIDWVPDARIAGIVAGWATRFDADRAGRLGFPTVDSMDDLIRAYIEDEQPRAL